MTRSFAFPQFRAVFSSLCAGYVAVFRSLGGKLTVRTALRHGARANRFQILQIAARRAELGEGAAHGRAHLDQVFHGRVVRRIGLAVMRQTAGFLTHVAVRNG